MKKCVGLLLVFSAVHTLVFAQSEKERLPADVLRRLQAQEPQDVILLFDDSEVAREVLIRRDRSGLRSNDPSLLDFKMSEFARLKERTLATLSPSDVTVMRDYSHLPMSLVRLRSESSAFALLNEPSVLRVYKNERLRPALAQSLPLISQPAVAAEGYTGAGTTVAVLDTGVNYLHSAFGPCTAPDEPAGCKVVYAQDFGSDDGQRDDDGHGTNVAAIVLGVAPEARVAALDVFDGNSAASSDVVDAINWSIANQGTYNIVALNLSLGGGFFSSPCTGSVFATPFSQAREAGIVPVVASGNDGRTTGMTEPACAPGAVRVGAVYDANVGPRSWSSGNCTDSTTAADLVTCFSNAPPFLTLLAPGAMILAADITQGGTSQATPHVAGAVAVLLGVDAGLAPAEVEAVLTTSGVPVADPRTQRTFPRLNLLSAVNVVLGNSPPFAPSNPLPANGASDVALAPTLSWTGGDTDEADTVTYDVYFGVSTNSPRVVTGQASLSYTPGTLSGGTTYYWKIVARDNQGANATGPTWSFTTSGGSCNERVSDGSFENGTPSSYWLETSTNFGTSLCTVDDCGNGAGAVGPRTGLWWAWFGGFSGDREDASLEQTVTIPAGNATLSFYLWNGSSSGNRIDNLRVVVDGTEVFRVFEGDALYGSGYVQAQVSLSAYANGGSHVLRFEYASTGVGLTSFSLDDVTIQACPQPTTATLRGTVTTAGGTPLAGVTVELLDAQGVAAGATQTTDQTGGYSFSGLAPGTYYLRTVNRLGFMDEIYDNKTCQVDCNVTQDGTPLVVVAGSDRIANFQLDAGGLIAGRVTDTAAVAVPQATIDVYDHTGKRVATGIADDAGNYKSRGGLAAGRYYVRTSLPGSRGLVNELWNERSCPAACSVASGDPIDVVVGATAPGINFTLERGGTINGRVTDGAAAAIPGVQVEIYSAGATVVGTLIAANDGTYASWALPPGSYRARTANAVGFINEVFDDHACGRTCDPLGGEAIVVSAGASATANFQLLRGGAIAGTVTNASSGAPLAGVRVDVFDATGELWFGVTTDSAGRYSTMATSALLAGSYRARTMNSLGFPDELWDNLPCASGTCNPATGTPINVSLGATTTANFALGLAPPGKASLVSPSGSITETVPTYTWNKVSDSTWYYLWVNAGSTPVVTEWYTSAQVCSGATTCSVTPSKALAYAAHTWWIQTWNTAGFGPWSDAATFTVTPNVPEAATLISPTGTSTETRPTYVWNAVAQATWYLLEVSGPQGALPGVWYTSASVCAGTTCSTRPDVILAAGSYTWTIRTWNLAGYGPTSAPLSFTVIPAEPPGAATLVSPSGNVDQSKPTYTWNAVNASTWYYLWVNDPTGVPVVQLWYTSQSVCSGATCSVKPEVALAEGSHTWWIETWNLNDYGPWSAPLSFEVSTAGGFDSQFTGSAPGWEAHSGSWFVAGNAWYSTLGVASGSASASRNVDYSDFTFDTRFWRDGCSTCATGVLVRGTVLPLAPDGGWASGYGFYYRGDGRFAVEKRVGGAATKLQDWTPSSTIVAGWNVLRVVASGSSLTFFINGVQVWQGSDATFLTGRVGLEMVRDAASTGNQVWVDYATLTGGQ